MAKKQTIYEIKVKGLDDIKSLNTEISKLNGNYDKLSKESGKASKSTGDVGKESNTAVFGLGKLVKGAVAATAALVAFQVLTRGSLENLTKQHKSWVVQLSLQHNRWLLYSLTFQSWVLPQQKFYKFRKLLC